MDSKKFLESRTVLFGLSNISGAVVLFLLEKLADFDWTAAVGPDGAAIALAVIGIVTIILRKITTKPLN